MQFMMESIFYPCAKGCTNRWKQQNRGTQDRQTERRHKDEKQQKILLNNDDRLQYQVRLKDELQAPVRKGEQIGRVVYMLNGQKIASFPILAVQNVDRITFLYCAELVFRNFFH